MTMEYSDVAQYYWGLVEVVSDILDQTGIQGDEVDLESLTGTVKGYVITNATAYAALSELGQTHLFDIINADARAIFLPREWANVFEVPFEDLIIDSDNNYLKVDASTEELPALIHVRYYDVMGGNAQSVQTSENVHMSIGSGEEVIEINELMEGSDAKRLAMIQHKIKAQLAKGRVRFSLPKKWAHISVGDVVELDGLRLRITKCTVDLLKQEYEAMHDRRSAYDAESPPLETPRASIPPSSIITPPSVALLDIPDFLEIDDVGLYCVVQRTSNNWKGCHLYVKVGDRQEEFWTSQIAEGLFGTLLNDVKGHEREVPDQFHELIVQLDNPSDTLPSLTQQQLLNREGMLLIGDEIISYRDSEMISDGVYKLTYLLRSRLGSGTAMGSWHFTGDRVISLSQGELPFMSIPEEDRYRSFILRAEAIGADSSGDSTTAQTSEALLAMTEQAPARVRITPADGGVMVDWSPVGKFAQGGKVEQSKHTTGAWVRVEQSESGGELPIESFFVPKGTNHFLVPYINPPYISVQTTNSITGPGAKKIVAGNPYLNQW